MLSLVEGGALILQSPSIPICRLEKPGSYRPRDIHISRLGDTRASSRVSFSLGIPKDLLNKRAPIEISLRQFAACKGTIQKTWQDMASSGCHKIEFDITLIAFRASIRVLDYDSAILI